MSIQNHFLSLLLLLDFLRLKIASGKGLCQPYSCLNGGICVEEETNFHCNCLLRFKGRYCQTRSSVCTEETCLNNGQCVENAGNFHCNCPEGFEGRQCEQTYSPATTVQTSGKQDDFVMEGKIIGSLVGGIIGVCLLAALVAYVWKKKHPKQSAGFGSSAESGQQTENNVYDEIPIDLPPSDSIRKYSGQYATILGD